jgi:hypothetical protein
VTGGLATNLARSRTSGYTQLVGIQTINTTTRELPDDLAGLPFDSPVVRARFHQLIDRLRPILENSALRYLSIGNEVDVYLAAHPAEWAAYRVFYEDAVDYVHQKLPALQVGVTVTSDGALTDHPAEVATLTRHSDAVILTYYPLNASFRVRAPSAARSDIARMVTLGNGRPVVLQEVGYPSAVEVGSSEQAQAEFVDTVFAAWADAGSAITFLNFYMLHDFSLADCSGWASYYGVGTDPTAVAFLCSLGLRQRDGTPKLAWTAFQRAALRR